MRIALAQLNPTVGDFVGNTGAVTAAMQRASEGGADMVVFSELVLPGYYPADLLLESSFLRQCDLALKKVLAASRTVPALVTVLGTVRPNGGPGRPIFNSLVAIRDGAIVAEYAKQLLPTYNVFDERRHFEPGPEATPIPLVVAGQRVGFMVCEDGWNLAGREYTSNPLRGLMAARPDIVVSINASPSNRGKRETRHRVFAAAATACGFPIVYVNQVGGQDQLVFDGASFIVDREGAIVAEATSFAEDFVLVEMRDGRFDSSALPGAALAPDEFARRQILLGLRDYMRRCGFAKVVVGSSGGIDSALTLALAVEALGPENVAAITMPSVYSSEGSVSDSQRLCDNLGICLLHHPIRELVAGYERGFAATFGEPLAGLALENLQARIRGTILMEHSNSYGALLLTTGNKSEVSVGYATLYGDTNGGLSLIGDLYKGEVWSLSRHLNARAGRALIPEAVINKAPSAELAPGQKDSDSLPPYEVLDAILKAHLEDGQLSADEAHQTATVVAELRATEGGAGTIQRVLRMVARAEYKRRQAPPILRVRGRSFGPGRQMPIAVQQRYF